ncbi:glycosyltransferase family 4 protein [Candidatus Pacearchaeota archaeon]|nr:glycosyltransferase family 4 protein [Candidatus Pacearchaeota archaeon]
MKKIKIYMQFPWRYGDSNYYKSLLEHAPKNVEYLNNLKHIGNITNNRKFEINNFIKQNIKKYLEIFFPFMINSHLTRCKSEYDLIHCAHCLSYNKRPWICDLEYPEQMWVSQNIKPSLESKKKVEKILGSDYCKKILSWTEWGKKDLIEKFPKIKEKIEVLHYAMPAQKAIKRNYEKITLFFFSRRFYFKGGLHAVEIMDRLTKKFPNVYGLVLSKIPKEVLDKYSPNKKIEFINSLVPYEKIMNEIFPRADIFLYPSYNDTYGFPMIEAQAFGIPVITVDGQSRREIVQDGKTGFVINEPDRKGMQGLTNLNTLKKTIDKLEKSTEILIKDKNLRKKMGLNCRKEIEYGKFSIEKRMKKLERIYEESINK